MEDWFFGAVGQREKVKTLNVLKGKRCRYCIFYHLTKETTWCRKKVERPAEDVCEWWLNDVLPHISQIQKGC